MKWNAYEQPDGKWIVTDLLTTMQAPDKATAERVARIKNRNEPKRPQGQRSRNMKHRKTAAEKVEAAMKGQAAAKAAAAKPAPINDGNPYPRTKLRGVLYAEGSKGYATETELFDRVEGVVRDRKWTGEKATREQIERCYKVVIDQKHAFNSKRSTLLKKGDTMMIVAVK
jgi:hypothetical protein